MPRLTLWKPTKTNDFKYIDGIVREQFHVGGTSVYIHKYIGIHDQGETDDLTQSGSISDDTIGETVIQDLLFLENRDLKYDQDVYELKGHYNVTDVEFNLLQFGAILDNDTIYITLHLNEMVEKIGRKLMSGDVIELPHQRDDLLLNQGPAINRYYKIEDASRAAEGYSSTWWPHIWRIKCKQLTNSQETLDILNKSDEMSPEVLLEDILTNYKNEIGISEKILEQAEAEVPFRYFETAHFYVIPGTERGSAYPWIFAGDGVPPNGAELAGSGNAFPESPKENEWYLRTDYDPYVLFRYNGGKWRRMEIDWRGNWSQANKLLESFINNKNETTLGSYGTAGGITFPERQYLSKAILPKADAGKTKKTKK